MRLGCLPLLLLAVLSWQPEIIPGDPPTASIAPRATPQTITGIASWYRWHPGEAAAGRALRAFLGPKWRGQTVQVCASRCIEVRLTDWMGMDRLIDLDSRSFSKLAPLSQGLVPVTISR